MTVAATVLADREWLAEDLVRARALYGAAGDRVLGTIRWYSASSVLLAPALEPFVHTGTARDPALDAVELELHPDGRYLDARSTRVLGQDVGRLGAALVNAVGDAVDAIASVCGAAPRALWAVATDSIANRMLWAGSAIGDEPRAQRLAHELGEAMVAASPEHAPPRPRFTTAGAKPIVRRSSCCLIYEAPHGQKCASCPRQTPAERAHRLRLLLG